MTNQQGAPEALRLRNYVERRKRAKQLDVNKVHAFDTGCDTEAELLLSDVETLLSLVEAQQRATHVQNPAEIEHVAGDVSKNGPKSNMAQQPATSAAAAVSDEDEALDLLATLFDDWESGTQCYEEPESSDGFLGHALRLDDEVFHRCADLLNRRRGKQPAPTAQADSQPAPVAAFEVADAMADSQYLAGVSAGWNAANADDPNAALQKLHESRAGYLKPLATARAPAGSVTAPAGEAGLMVDRATVIEWLDANDIEVTDRQMEGLFHFAAPTPPAQAAESVREDAARWQMAVLVGNEVMLHPDKRSNPSAVKAYMDAVHSGLDLTGAVDAARKQGGAT